VNNAAAPQEYTREQIELIKNTVAKGATEDELKMFIAIAQKYGLDPFVKEIWFIKRAKKAKTGRREPNGKDIWDYPRLPNSEIDYSNAETIIMTSRDGYLSIAQRNQEFDGIISFVVREGDAFEIDAENYKVAHKFGLKRGRILGAWSKVSRKGMKPVITWAEFSEYNDEKSTTWKQYPSAMIQKVAEVFALKRQFGISGLVTREEMAHQVKDEEFDEVLEVKLEEMREAEPDAEQAPVIHLCSDCNKEIAGNAKASIKEVIDYSIENHDRILCTQCLTEMSKLIKAIRINKSSIMQYNTNYNEDSHKQELQSMFGVDSSKKLTIEQMREYTKHQADLIAQLKK
jgi:phage recombination protein Bet